MGLSASAVEGLLEPDTRPRMQVFDDGVLVTLRGVNLNPESEVEDMVAVRVWLEKERVITTSRRSLRSVHALQAALEPGQELKSPGDFMVRLTERIGKFIGQTIEEYEETVEAIEDSLESSMVARNSPFNLLRRRAARIRRYLVPQREALDRLSRLQNELFTDQERLQLAEEANHTMLLIENLELAQERATVAHEEFLAIIAHEQNSRVLLLSIVAAIFLPLAFITGLMGMNVAGLPGTENEWSFWMLCGFMLLVALGILAIFRARRWV
jgi:zinc transporter